MVQNLNQIAADPAKNGNVSYHQVAASSAQPVESRMIQGKNLRPTHESMDQNSKNLVLNIQDESIIDMIVSQQKSNKNASVKSGKRSVCHSTSTTNKRKKSLNKRK